MLRSLHQNPEKGFLGRETFVYWPGVGLMQYCRSFEDLERFSRNQTNPRLDHWQRFNRAIGADGSVGIWHETYMVEPGRYQAIYGNMPIVGLAAATKHVPVIGRSQTARRCLGDEGESVAG